MALVAFVVNRTLLRDPRRFLVRCRIAAEDRGWDPWFGPAGGAQDSLALTRRAVAAGASLVFAANLTARALSVPSRGGRAVDLGHLTLVEGAGGTWFTAMAWGRRQDRALGCLQARRVQVSADTVLPRQVDGEIVAPGRALTVLVCPGTLVVRLPGPARRTSANA
jgi:hypothetical protein